DRNVTGVQTCALPILKGQTERHDQGGPGQQSSHHDEFLVFAAWRDGPCVQRGTSRNASGTGAEVRRARQVCYAACYRPTARKSRSEERRVGKECGYVR